MASFDKDMNTKSNMEPATEVDTSSSGHGYTIDIQPLLTDVSKLMTTHVSRILDDFMGEYSLYKETHQAIMSLPCIRKLESKLKELERMKTDSSDGNSASIIGSNESDKHTHTPTPTPTPTRRSRPIAKGT